MTQANTCECAKILIVDDEYVNIYALQILLKNLKLIADTAFNGEDVLAYYLIMI